MKVSPQWGLVNRSREDGAYRSLKSVKELTKQMGLAGASVIYFYYFKRTLER